MKNLSKYFVFAVMGMAVACNNAPEETVETTEAQEVEDKSTEASAVYTVDTTGDEIKWTGFKTYAETVHTGHIQMNNGQVLVENGEITGGTFVINMHSISNEDLPEEGDFNKARLIGHLESEDFFHAEEYPTATFTITNVEKAPDTLEVDASHLVKGNLTMRGNTKNITVPANVEMSEDELSVTTPEFVIDRTQWEVMFGSDKLESKAKDQLIDNNIKLELDFTATPEEA